MGEPDIIKIASDKIPQQSKKYVDAVYCIQPNLVVDPRFETSDAWPETIWSRIIIYNSVYN